MFGVGVMEMVLLFGFPAELPLGMPPRPEDPKVFRSAPEECLVFLSWAGTADAKPDSENRTELVLGRSGDPRRDQHAEGTLEEGGRTGPRAKASGRGPSQPRSPKSRKSPSRIPRRFSWNGSP